MVKLGRWLGKGKWDFSEYDVPKGKAPSQSNEIIEHIKQIDGVKLVKFVPQEVYLSTYLLLPHQFP